MEDINRIKAILIKALTEEMSLEGFYKMCEDDWEMNPLLNAIIENIESYIEHQTTTNLEERKRREEFKIMEYDLGVLQKLDNKSMDSVLARRQFDLRHL